jgi:signal transduction histidine kinase
LAQERAKQPADLDSLARSDVEDEIETWLEDKDIENAWEMAPTLVNLGYDSDSLAALANDFTAEQLPAVIAAASSTYTIYSLLEEIHQGAGRISEIVKALKSYTYLDQAPIQSVDVREGLNDTLVMLRSKLKAGIVVHREYAEDLPQIQAYGSELNQVWTNIIDNAIGAMGGKGEISLRARGEDSWVVVEIEDTGPGIPEEIQSKLFDPFFTTKPPGEGTGLGLNISHNIIVQKHGGKITIFSQPGKTCFEIRLPINNENT